MNQPRPFEVYRHFKGKLYQIIAIAEHSEDGSRQVVYQQLYAPYKVYVRPYEMFVSRVDREKYPDVVQEYRFEKIDPQMTDNTQSAEKPAVQTAEQQTEQQIEQSAEEFELDPALLRFLDADTYEEKLEILNMMHSTITQEMINTIAAALDIEVKAGELEDRYDEVKNCLITMERFECNRLR